MRHKSAAIEAYKDASLRDSPSAAPVPHGGGAEHRNPFPFDDEYHTEMLYAFEGAQPTSSIWLRSLSMIFFSSLEI